MRRRIMALVLALLMIMGSIPAEPIFADTNNTQTGFMYTTGEQGATITGYRDKTVSRIIIPKEIDGHKVIAIEQNAFNYSTYKNLDDITVLGDDVNIGEKMCGFDSDSSRNDNLVLWGNEGSTLQTYANNNLFPFKTLATGISEITTEQDANKCYTEAGTFVAKVTLTGDNTEDVIWESEDDTQVSIKPFGTPERQNDGTMLAQATVEVLSKGDGTCKIYAGARGLDIRRELELTLIQSATGIDIEAKVYRPIYDESEKKIIAFEPVNVPDTFYQNGVVTIDVGNFLWVKGTAVGSDEDGVSAWKQKDGNISYYSVYNDGYLYSMDKTTASSYTKMTFTTYSLVRSKTINVRITQPATKIEMYINNNLVDAGTSRLLIAGDKASMTAKLLPNNPASTDMVKWSSSNTNVATIAEDGSVTTHQSGITTITCTVINTAGSYRRLSSSFNLKVAKKMLYGKLELATEPTSTNSIKEMDLEAGTEQRLYPIDMQPTEGEEPNEHLIYTSSHPEIATVDDEGVIRAVAGKAGSTTITVSTTRTDNTNSTWSVVVHTYIKATNIVTTSAIQIPEGQSREISYTLAPNGATEDVIWTSADTSKATVTTDGNGVITVKALKVGTVTIQGRTKSGGATVSLQVSIPEAIHMNTMGISVKDASSYTSTYIDSDDVQVYKVPVNNKIVFSPTYAPENANDELKWASESGKDGIAIGTINAGNLTVSAKTVGKATFTLTSSEGKVAKVRIEVIIPSTSIIIRSNQNANISHAYVPVGGTLQVKAVLIPISSTDNIKWTSSNNNISLNDSQTKTNGIVTITGKAIGNTRITATTESGKEAYIDVDVIIPTTAVKLMENNKEINSIELIPNQTKNFTLDVEPDNTTDTEYTWTCNGGKVNIISADHGRKIKVTGLATGSDIIKVTSSSGFTKTYNVSVLIPAESIEFKCNYTTINKGSNVSATVTVNPVNSNDKITYTVDNEGIVSIEPNTSNNKMIMITGLETGTVVITATTTSGQTASIELTVVTVDMNDPKINITGINSSYIYTGEAIKPNVVVRYNNQPLKLDVDYTVEYDNNINVTDKASIEITGIGKYSGSIEKNFKIAAKNYNQGVTVTFEENGQVNISGVYDGNSFRPAIVVKNGTLKLEEGIDYDVTYPEECINVSSNYKVTVKFKGNYDGTLTRAYSITAKDLTSNDIAVTGLNANGYTYTGSAIIPSVVVSDSANALVLGTDYTVSARNNLNATTGTTQAELIINGKGNYKGNLNLEFKIKRKSIANASVTAIPDRIYNGNAQIATTQVKFGNRNATVTCKYANNKNVGRASLIITGTGNYTGTKTVYYKILPSSVQNIKQTGAAANAVKLSWNKNAGGVSGYAIYKYTQSSKKYTYIGSTTRTSYTIKKLAAGNAYQFAVRAYKTVGKSKYYGAYSLLCTGMTSCATPKISSLRSTTPGFAVVKWKAVKGATKYNIYVSTNGKKYKLATTSSATLANLTRLRSRRYVYVKIRSIRTINRKDYFSGYSAAKRVRVK